MDPQIQRRSSTTTSAFSSGRSSSFCWPYLKVKLILFEYQPVLSNIQRLSISFDFCYCFICIYALFSTNVFLYKKNWEILYWYCMKSLKWNYYVILWQSLEYMTYIILNYKTDNWVWSRGNTLGKTRLRFEKCANFGFQIYSY